MREIGYHEAETVEDALDLASRHGEEALFLAGGQSLVVMMKSRLLSEGREVIHLGGLEDLSYIEEDGDAIRIGALTSHADVVDSTLLADRIPAFPEMVAQVGDIQVRTMGTVGGDLAQADPQADYPVLVTALDAELRLRSEAAERTVPAEAFFVGYFETALEPDELLVEVVVPIPGEGAAVGFSKFAERKGDFPLLNAAALVEVADGTCSRARVRIGCVGGTPVAAADAEDALEGTPVGDLDPAAAGQRARAEVEPDPSEQLSVEYQRDLTAAMVENAVADCVERLGA